MLRRDCSFLIALGLVAAAGMAVAWIGRGGNHAQSISSGVLEHDFGDQIIQGSIELEHVFVLQNDSGRSLKIQKVATTCGCTGAKASQSVVPAGDIFEVTAMLKLASAGSKREQIN